jgi:hypothetical protein
MNTAAILAAVLAGLAGFVAAFAAATWRLRRRLRSGAVDIGERRTLDIGPLAGETLTGAILAAIGATGPPENRLTLIVTGDRPLAVLMPLGEADRAVAEAVLTADLSDLADVDADLAEPRRCARCGEVTTRWFDGLYVRCVRCFPPGPGLDPRD